MMPKNEYYTYTVHLNNIDKDKKQNKTKNRTSNLCKHNRGVNLK